MAHWITLLALAILCSGPASANTVIGTWKTESTEAGDYLHVEFSDCEDKLCGTIVNAYNKQHQPADEYEHLGKQMVWGMVPSSGTSWQRGKIWAPDTDKTYKSKMKLIDGKLSVSGCVLMFCRSQIWTRVE